MWEEISAPSLLVSSEKGLVFGESGWPSGLTSSQGLVRNEASDLEAGFWRAEPGLGIGQGSLVVLSHQG